MLLFITPKQPLPEIFLHHISHTYLHVVFQEEITDLRFYHTFDLNLFESCAYGIFIDIK